jgi:antitoxin HicB
MTTKKPRSTDGFSTLDDLLGEQGTHEAFQAVAVKEVLAWQIEKAVNDQKLSSKRLAEEVETKCKG